MPLTLYGLEYSPAVRSVNLVIHTLGLEAEFKVVELGKREHLTPEFLKLNPLHTVPVIDDDGFILWESRAIMTYLVSKYSKDDTLYPKDLKKRAIVDQRLHYNSDVFYICRTIARDIIFFNAPGITESQLKEVEKAQDNIEKLLEGHSYIAGDDLTVADYSYVTLMDLLEECNPSDSYPLTKAWLERCKSSMKDFEKVNRTGAEQVITGIKEKVKNIIKDPYEKIFSGKVLTQHSGIIP